MRVPRKSRKHPLAKRDRARIRSIKVADVEATFANLNRFFNGSSWLGSQNRYSEKTIDKISSDAKLGRIRSPRQLAQYIAASSVLHCADGWSYLGRSILSLLRGDPHRARHLAYYAELRAAMAILATEGIGIFKNKHFIIDGPDSVVRLDTKRGTHDVVWDCLDYWSRQQRSGDIFAEIIAPYGRTLDGWLTPIGGGNIVSPQAQIWFRQWGMDLRTFPDDRDARNVSSYRPDGIPSSWFLAAPDVLSFVRDVWSVFQPAENARFDGIDKHILRITLESTYRGRTGNEPADDRDAFKVWLNNIVDYQAFSPEISAHWAMLLNREIVPNDPSVFSCSAKSAEILGSSHFSIMSRAALLLRIASGSTARLVHRSGLTPDSIRFWWNDFGQARGLWEGQKEADTLTDLWADIEVCLSEIDDLENRNLLAQQTFYRIGNELSHALACLASCERVAIWGIAN